MRIIFLTSLEPRILTSYILHDKGRISKLMLKRKEEIIANYDRGWDIEPVDEDTEIALAILLLEHN
jgi:hypothetical protein